MRAVEARPLTLGALGRLLRAQGDGAIHALCPGPVLVVTVPGSGVHKVDTPHAGIALPRSEETAPVDGESTRSLPSPSLAPWGPGAGWLVRPLAKSERNPFADVITVGRAANNDVVIESPQVSKVHAWVRLMGDRLVISDNGSTNGTVLDDLRLVPKVDYTLRSGATLRLGTIECRFLEPAELLEVCAAL